MKTYATFNTALIQNLKRAIEKEHPGWGDKRVMLEVKRRRKEATLYNKHNRLEQMKRPSLDKDGQELTAAEGALHGTARTLL